MNGLKTVTIGSLGNVVTGSTPSKKDKDNYGDYALWIKPTDINENEKYTRFTEEMFSKKSAEQCKSRIVPKDSICVPCIGTIGTKLTMTPCDCFVNQSINAIVPNEDFDNHYVYYLLRNFLPSLKSHNKGTASGREFIAKTAFEEIEIKVFEDKQIQQKIGLILSEYDNLIDNYRRQIKLLEEAAQRLYKEWFVDLRFPGHEHTKIVDGVPEGWRWGTLGEIVNINYGKDHKKAPLDGNIPVFGSGGLMRMCNKSLFSGESVLIPRKGSLNNIIYVNCTFWTVDTMFFTSMKIDHCALFVYFFLKGFDMYGLNIGAAVPSMTTKILNTLDILIPNKDTLCSFDNAAQTLYQTILKLQKLILLTQEARDRLLPKLMSGEIKV